MLERNYMAKIKKTEIPVKIDIWNTYYTIRTSDAKTMELLRKAVEYEKSVICPKNGQPIHFIIEDILAGIPQYYGWEASDF